MDSIKLRVVSDGTSEGTFVTDQDGRTLDNIIHFQWVLGMDGNPQMVLTLVGVPTEINYVADLTTIGELPTPETIEFKRE